MNRTAKSARLTAALVLLTSWLLILPARGESSSDIPAPFAPLEYLIGRWTGQGVPKDNPAKQFRGWTEKHAWAWMFAQGRPVGLSLSIEGGKIIASGKLTYDPARKLYRLEAREPGRLGAAITFEGAFDKTGKRLALDHVVAITKSKKPPGTMRISIWPNANFIRYTMAHDLKEAGSVQFSQLSEVGLTRDGESLGIGATASERPRCIVTGGAANMSVSYEGRMFSVCCTGCRDEFNENPEKYIKKASLLRGAQAGKADSSRPAVLGVSRFEDAFAGDVTDSVSQARGQGNGLSSSAARNQSTALSPPTQSKAGAENRSKKDSERSNPTKPAMLAGTLLKLGQNLETSGKTTAALGYYRRVAKEFPGTEAAKTAVTRIKALEQ
jgi:hypothetical protein